MSITVKVNGSTADQYIRRVSFRNSLESSPAIEIEPADTSWSAFDTGAIVSIYDGATKLLEGEIKDVTVNNSSGITAKNARIHVKDIKEKVFSYDVSDFGNMTNKTALQQLCNDAGVTCSLISSLGAAHRFTMKTEDKSVPFFSMIQEICSSEGWGCYGSHDTIYVKDLINDTANTYSINSLVDATHKVNDLNCYGNVCVKGNVSKERLISDNNPYVDLRFADTATIDSMSITADNSSDLISIISDGSYGEYLLDDDNGKINLTFNRVNATSILATFQPDTVSIVDTSENFVLTGYESIPYNASDKIGDQCERLDVFGYIPNPEKEIKIILDIKAKKISYYSLNNTPDLFLLVAKDTNATANAKGNYLYYENDNIGEFEQLETIASNLLRETSNRVLTLEFKLYTTTVYKPLDRLYIYDTKPEYNGYWTAVDVRINKTANFQVVEFKCIRANTAIIPQLNIYVWDTILNKIKDVSERTYRVMFTGNDTFYDFKYDKIKTLTNPYKISTRKGDIGYVDKLKRGDYALKARSEKEYKLNEDKIKTKNFDSSGIESTKGGWTSAYDSAWISGTSATSSKKYDETIPGTTAFEISTVTSTYLGNEEAEIEITFSTDIDESTFDKTCLKVFSVVNQL
jgi:hypothetical protein